MALCSRGVIGPRQFEVDLTCSIEFSLLQTANQPVTNQEASHVDVPDVEVVGGVAVLDDVVRDVEDVGAAVDEEAAQGDPLRVPQHLVVALAVRQMP